MTGVPLVRQLFSIQLTRPRATAYLPSSAMLRPALLALLVMAGCSGGEEQSDATSAQSSTTQVGADNGQPDTDSDGSPQSGGADSQSSTEAPRGGNDSVSCAGRMDGTIAVEGAWSTCAYSSVCDEEGTRQRMITRCENGQPVDSEETSSETCERRTDGTLLLEGPYGLCEYASACESMGTRQRTNRICSEGVEIEVRDEQIFADCQRETDGLEVSVGEYGACEYATTCATGGIRRRVASVCLGGVLTEREEVEAFPDCARETDGQTVEMGPAQGCIYDDECAEIGQRQYANRVCSAGEIVEILQGQADETCRRSTAEKIIDVGQPGACQYENVCSTAGYRIRTNQICRNGAITPVDVQAIEPECNRVTDNTIVAFGAYGDCLFHDACADEGHRTRLNRACIGGIETEIEESVSFPECRRQQEGIVVSQTDFSDCAYDSMCDQSGFRSRTKTICRAGIGADEVERTTAPECARVTEGQVVETGEYGECIYDTPCSEVGRQSRVNRVCVDGAVTDVSESREGDECDRNVDGTVVDPGLVSECEYAEPCAQTGTRTRSEMICAGGEEIVRPVVEDAPDCARNTDGEVLSEGPLTGDCVYTDQCEASGTQSQAQEVCEAGRMVSRSINLTSPACQRVPIVNEEVCNGRDDDCDGTSDEAQILGNRFVRPGEPCGTAFGVCRRDGRVVCDPSGSGGVICEGPTGTGTAEQCDGLDNDCDGELDEDFRLGDVCSVGQGQCIRQGVRVCLPDGTDATCDAQPGALEGEKCNGLDDDCDGSIDEENPEGGGQCETARPGRCRPGRLICRTVAGVTALSCESDDEAIDETCNGLDDDCDGNADEGDPGGGMQCQDDTQLGRCRLGLTRCMEGGLMCETQHVAGVETCNREDDDCDGRVDEVLGAGDMCTTGIGGCQRQGVLTCTFPDDPNTAGTLACNAVPGQPTAEACDGIDNNCDGSIDEGFQVGQFCTIGIGVCSEPGRLACNDDGSGTVCDGRAGESGVELCNGLDDDCDGELDENNPQGGGPCETQQLGRCRAGTLACRTIQGVTQLECDRVDGPIVETCNGVDDDCDGEVDNGFALNLVCAVGVGECRRQGQTVCGIDDPDDGDGVTCGVQPGQPIAELCNDKDDDCDGAFDEDLDKGAPCGVGVGICRRNGVNVCGADGGVICSAQPGQPLDVNDDGVTDELCNGADDDCDGRIDEGNPEGGVDCPMNNQGVCSVGTLICQANGVLSCIPLAIPGQFQETCNTRDDDCDGETDEDVANEACRTGRAGVCGDGVTRCIAGLVQCVQTMPLAPEVCDELDNDCDEKVDEDFVGVGEACDSPDDADLCAGGLLECDPSAPSGTRCVGDEPQNEVCNQRDDDCDGVIDNGFNLQRDKNHCGACGNVCPGPNPQCISGACFRTFWVSEADGSNAEGDGSSARPWRSIRHALSNDRVPPEDLNNGVPPARIYVMPGRYAADQWVDLPQCDSTGDGTVDDGCAERLYACETDGNQQTVERCSQCVCLPELACVGGLCSLPIVEREVLPVPMVNTIQVVGFGNPDHIVIDGGIRACFEGTFAGDCDIQRSGVGNLRGRLLTANDMMDERAQLDERFQVGQPRWYGMGSRNLFAGFTLMRGGYQSAPAVRIDSSQAYLATGRKTAMRVLDVRFRDLFAGQAYTLLEAIDSDVLLDHVDVRNSNATGSNFLVLVNRARLTIESSHFQQNDVFSFTGAMVQVSDAWCDVRNSTFANNDGGGVWFNDKGRGMVTYSSFAGNSYYNVVAAVSSESPIVVANNLFTETTNVASVFVHQTVENNVALHNNLFFETSGPFVSGRTNISDIDSLNGRTFASDNADGDPFITSLVSNNLRIREQSAAIDLGSVLPVAQPNPTNVVCANDDDCIDAQDFKWKLPANQCAPQNVCVVDVDADADSDSYPDWIERVLGSDPEQPSSVPPQYKPRTDFDGIPRPSGAAWDVGAFEFPINF